MTNAVYVYEPVHADGYCYNLISGCRTTLEPLEDEEPDTGSTTFFTPDGPSDAGGGNDQPASRPWRTAPTSPPGGVFRRKAQPLRGKAGLASQGTTGRIGRSTTHYGGLTAGAADQAGPAQLGPRHLANSHEGL